MKIKRSNVGSKPLPYEMQPPRKQREMQGVPESDGKIPNVPRELTFGAKKCWNFITKRMPKGVLAQVDLHVLAQFCVSWDIYLEAYKVVQESGVVVKSQKKIPYQNPYLSIMNRQVELMNKLGARLGLSPSDRTRIRIDSEQAVDEALSKVEEARKRAEEIKEERIRRVK